MKSKFKYSIFLIFLLFVQASSINCKQLKIKSDKNQTSSILKGWLKYLIVDSTNKTISSEFFKNNYFYQQIEQNIERPRVSANSNDIPYIDYFYFELFNDRIAINSASSGKLRHLVDTIYLSDYDNPKMNFNCVVQDLGKFNEGHCFSIRFRKILIFEACADTFVEKVNWMNAILKMKQIPNFRENSQVFLNLFKSFKFVQKSIQPNSIFKFNHDLIGRIKKKSIYNQFKNQIMKTHLIEKADVNNNQHSQTLLNGYSSGIIAISDHNLLIKSSQEPIATLVDNQMKLNKDINNDEKVISETSVQRIYGKTYV